LFSNYDQVPINPNCRSMIGKLDREATAINPCSGSLRDM
jgi:hypothetical protein